MPNKIILSEKELSFLKENSSILSIRKISLILKIHKRIILRNCRELKLKLFSRTKHKYIPNIILNNLQYSAERRNLKVDISPEDIWEKYLSQDKLCALTGKFINLDKNKGEITASPDRINSNKGYIKGNIQLVHKKINKFKSNWEEKILYNMSKDFVNYRKDLNLPKKIVWKTDIWNDTEYPIFQD